MKIEELRNELQRVSLMAANLRPALVGTVPDEKARNAVVATITEIQDAIDALADRLPKTA